MLDNSEDNNKLHGLEDVQQKLYSRTGVIRKKKEKPLSKVSYGMPTAWAGAEDIMAMRKKRRMSPFKNFFILSLIIFLGAASFSAYKFYGGRNFFSAQNLDILITGNAFIQSGEDLNLEVSINNKNTIPVTVSNLYIEYTKGGSTEEESGTPTLERKKIEMESVAAGGITVGQVRLALYGDQGTKRTIRAVLEYRTADVSATFIKDGTFEVTFASSPLTISVDSPTSVNPNFDTTLVVKISSNAATILPNLLVKVLYPIGFEFKQGTPAPFMGDNIWSLGDLAPGGQKKITLEGAVFGESGDKKFFHILTGEQDKGSQSEISTLYSSYTHQINLAAASLLAILSINGVDQVAYAATSQKTVTATVAWSNNAAGRINDFEIRTKITGNALNKNSIKPKSGFYSIVDEAIIWNKESIPSFASVAPGESGTVSFDFASTSTQFPDLLQSPQILLVSSIGGSLLSAGNVLEPVSSVDREKTVKIVSTLQLATRSVYSVGPLQNSGPVPPKVGQKTTYTIYFTITNSTNDVEKAEVRAKLAPFAVVWLKKVFPAGEDVTYNNLTKEIIWRAGRVTRGTGLSGAAAKEVAFQVELSPSVSQVGNAPVLVGESTLTGDDGFANVTLKSTRPFVSTRTTADPNYKADDETVIQ